MDQETVREMIAALTAEETSLVDTIKKTDLRLTQVRAAREALQVLESDEPIEFEVRDQFKGIGYDTSPHTNILASVHSVLKRLADAKSEQKDVKAVDAKDGSGTRYYWAGEREIVIKASAVRGMTPVTSNALLEAAIGAKAMADQYGATLESVRKSVAEAEALMKAAIGPAELARIAKVAEEMKALQAKIPPDILKLSTKK
jgi:hypothetical protein